MNNKKEVNSSFSIFFKLSIIVPDIFIFKIDIIKFNISRQECS